MPLKWNKLIVGTMHTDNKSFAYSSSSGHKSTGRKHGRCGKWSLNIEISVGHWLECGVPIKLSKEKLLSSKYDLPATVFQMIFFFTFWTYVNIFSNWLRSDVPGNKARRENNSAIIQAELHISTALLYDWFNSTSGARYHNVTTCKNKRSTFSFNTISNKERIIDKIKCINVPLT